MKKLKLIFIIVLFVHTITKSQSPSWLWARNFGGTKEVRVYDIALDNEGCAYTSGSFLGVADFNPDTSSSFDLTASGAFNADLFISKLDSSGNFVWAKNIGIASEEIAYSLVTDDFANLYVTGVFSGTVDFDPGPNVANLISAGAKDVFVLKLDSSGNFVWARNVGGTNEDVAFAIALDPLNNILVTGSFSATADFDPGPSTFNLTTSGPRNIYVLKLNNTGDFVWAKQIGGNGQDWNNAIATDEDGNVYTTGKFYGSIDFDPSTITSDSVTALQYDDTFISKLDSSGNYVWAAHFPGYGNEMGYGLSADEPGKLYFTGRFDGTVDFDPSPGDTFNITSTGNNDSFICKLTTNGSFVWVKSFDGADAQTGLSLAFDPSGNGAIISGGSFTGTTDFDPGTGNASFTSAGNVDLYISKLDTAGNFVWATSIGNSDNEGNASLALSTTGKLYMSGIFNSLNISFGSLNISNVNTAFTAFDTFVAKMDNISTGIENPASFSSSLGLYPNPVNATLNISLPANSGTFALSIMDMTGKIVRQLDELNEQTLAVSTSDLTEGMYMVKATTTSTSYFSKFLILRN